MARPGFVNKWSAKHKHKVYEPGEDSYLMVDTMLGDLYEVVKAARIIVECGSGSGIVSAHACAIASVAHVVSVDISPYAVECSLDTIWNIHEQRSRSDIVRMDKLLAFRGAIADVVICNPPYYPSEVGEVRDYIDMAWAGGIDGVELFTRQLVSEAFRVLRPGGHLILLLEKRNKPSQFLSATDFREVVQISERKVPGELLSVWLLTK